MLKNKVDKRKKSASEIHPLHPVYNRTWRTSVLIVTFRKCDLVPEGEIFNIHIPHGISFYGLGDLMMKMDRIYDLLDYPQAELRIRCWNDVEHWKGTPLESDAGWNYSEDAAQQFHDKIATGGSPSVYVETRFRRYGSWQGILQAGKKKASYRSALEFLHYLTEYISDKKTKNRTNFYFYLEI